ncbi:MAG: xanthine dehydrogenase family protein subunit M [Gemmatimonadota bacterium]
MKPTAFHYIAPETVEEALAALTQYGDEAKVLAGGQSLVPVMNFRLARPAVLVDLNRITALSGMAANGTVRIGAMTRQRAVERDAQVKLKAPLLVQALPHVAHPQIRNRGTIGGSLAHADPAAELPAMMLALDARLRLRRGSAERWLEATGFYTGLFTTALAVDELLVEIELPALPARSGTAFEEVARRHGDYALLAVGAVVALDAGGICRHARIAYVNAGPGPLRSTKAEAVLLGERPTPALFSAAVDTALGDLRPPTDVHASADFRRHLGRVLTERVLRAAFAHAAA